MNFTDIHIFPFSNQLKVSQTVLDLNAVSLHTNPNMKKYASLMEPEARGLLIFGKHNLQVENVLKTNFALLIESSCVKKKDLEMELFALQVFTHFFSFIHSFTTSIVASKNNFLGLFRCS